VEVKKLDLHYARASWGDVIEAAGKLLLAVMYAFFLYAFIKDFVENQRLSSLLFAIVESLFLYMSVTRRPPVELSTFGPAWLFGYVGTFSPLLLSPSPSVDTNLGPVVQVAGVILIGLAIGSLGRSFGIVAANRGVVISGMYRWIRHPMYMAYFVNIAGFMINNISLNNVAIVFVLVFAQLARIQYEEKLLRKDPVYAQYAERVRWRLIPYIY